MHSMIEKEVRADFVDGHYQFSTPAGDAYAYTATTGPYEYLLGALSGCLFMTFQEIAVKMHISWEHVSFQTHGTKRDETPTWLKECSIHVTATGVEEKDKFTKCFEKATRYCSIFQTLAHVAEMHWDIEFV